MAKRCGLCHETYPNTAFLPGGSFCATCRAEFASAADDDEDERTLARSRKIRRRGANTSTPAGESTPAEDAPPGPTLGVLLLDDATGAVWRGKLTRVASYDLLSLNAGTLETLQDWYGRLGYQLVRRTADADPAADPAAD